MSGSFSITGRWSYPTRLPLPRLLALLARALLILALLILAFLSLGSTSSPTSAAEPAMRLLDRQPFDRITLDDSNANEAIDTLLLNLPGRRVPNPFPTEGSLELRRLSEPSTLYTVNWTSIQRIELFEQLLLIESVRLVESRDLTQAQEYLNFLYQNYPQLAGLKLATEKYLRQDGLAAYNKQDHEEALTILLSLYDLNPQHQGLKKFVETVTDRLIAERIKARNFAAARSVLDLLASGFPRLQPSNVAIWQTKFEKAAARQLLLARQAIDQKLFLEARQALRRALAILPVAAGAEEMLAEIDRKSPLVVVGVDQLEGSPRFRNDLARNELDWTTRRIHQLTEPRLFNLIGFGAEGGDYECSWADIVSDDTGLIIDLHLNAAALREGISAEVLALELLRQSEPDQPQFRAEFAGVFSHVEIRQGNVVSMHLQRSHVRPEALLPMTLKNITRSASPPGTYQPSRDEESTQSTTYLLPKTTEPTRNSASSVQQSRGPETISEQFYDNEETALADLLSGEVDILARVPPWQVDRLKQTDGIVISPYRLPTIHVLLPNYAKPIMGRREFRRALCYGIDRPQILNDILLGGEKRAGYRVLSGPLPAGITLTDPVGYAYNQGLQPRTYEPRLAAVLATVARKALAAKVAASAAKTAGQADLPGIAGDAKLVTPPAQPLILAHPPSPVATTVCQSIKLQLDAVGISIKLARFAALDTEMPAADALGRDHRSPTRRETSWDLRYAELAMWEPIVDARRLLGPQGLAGNCSSSMSLALRDVDQANNWKQARARLQEVHQTAFYDLSVIPLWQTVEFFAYRKSLVGIGAKPVTLYQNVADWKRASLANNRGAGR